jgi:hypothetical protein
VIFRNGIPLEKQWIFRFPVRPPIGRPERKNIHCREWKRCFSDVMTTAFDESSRPVATMEFEFPAEPEPRDGERVREIERVSTWFWRTQDWILAGRTKRSRWLRADICRSRIQGGTTLASIARRYGITRQAVQKLAGKVDTTFHGETQVKKPFEG